jgi:hypothetical protein
MPSRARGQAPSPEDFAARALRDGRNRVADVVVYTTREVTSLLPEGSRVQTKVIYRGEHVFKVLPAFSSRRNGIGKVCGNRPGVRRDQARLSTSEETAMTWTILSILAGLSVMGLAVYYFRRVVPVFLKRLDSTPTGPGAGCRGHR